MSLPYSRAVQARQAIAAVIHVAWHAAERGPLPAGDYAERIDTIIDDAIEDEAEQRCREAFEAGYREGYSDGKEAGYSEALVHNDNSG
jgi:hypothetical protein